MGTQLPRRASKTSGGARRRYLYEFTQASAEIADDFSFRFVALFALECSPLSSMFLPPKPVIRGFCRLVCGSPAAGTFTPPLLNFFGQVPIACRDHDAIRIVIRHRFFPLLFGGFECAFWRVNASDARNRQYPVGRRSIRKTIR